MESAVGNQDVAVLNSLTATTFDSMRGFEDAAADATDPRLKRVFSDFAAERRAIVTTLKDAVRRFGGTPEENGTAAGAAHRLWMDLKAGLASSNRAAIESVETGEAYLRMKYEEALADKTLTPGVRDIIADAFTAIAKGDRVHELRRCLGMTDSEQRAGGRLNWNRVGMGIGVAAAVIAGAALAASRRGGRSMRGIGETPPPA